MMDGRVNQLIEDVEFLKRKIDNLGARDHWAAALDGTGYGPADVMDLILAFRSQKQENERLRFKLKGLEGWRPLEAGYVCDSLHDEAVNVFVSAGGQRLVIGYDLPTSPGCFADLPANVRLCAKER